MTAASPPDARAGAVKPPDAALALPRELTIYNVSELRTHWLDVFSRPLDDDTFSADGAAVEEVDAAGLQLLISLSQTVQRRERRLRVLRPSAALTAACGALGTQALLADNVLGASA